MDRQGRFDKEMYSGTLINDLFALVERTAVSQTQLDGTVAGRREEQPNLCHCAGQNLESEQLAQSFGLSPADWNLSLLLVIHAQLVRALEPRDNFADSVGVHQVGAVRPPKQIRV